MVCGYQRLGGMLVTTYKTKTSIDIFKAVITSNVIQYRVYHFKSTPKTITYYGTKMKSEACQPPCNRLSQRPP
jgi:hypothetical protein